MWYHVIIAAGIVDLVWPNQKSKLENKRQKMRQNLLTLSDKYVLLFQEMRLTSQY